MNSNPHMLYGYSDVWFPLVVFFAVSFKTQYVACSRYSKNKNVSSWLFLSVTWYIQNHDPPAKFVFSFVCCTCDPIFSNGECYKNKYLKKFNVRTPSCIIQAVLSKVFSACQASTGRSLTTIYALASWSVTSVLTIVFSFLFSWSREKKLKARVQELVSALERLTKSSEIRHQQSAEFVNDLKRANRWRIYQQMDTLLICLGFFLLCSGNVL